MQNTTPFLRDIEVAKRYKLSRSTIWRWVNEGRFPSPMKLGPSSTRWRLSDLEEWECLQSKNSIHKEN